MSRQNDVAGLCQDREGTRALKSRPVVAFNDLAPGCKQGLDWHIECKSTWVHVHDIHVWLDAEQKLQMAQSNQLVDGSSGVIQEEIHAFFNGHLSIQIYSSPPESLHSHCCLGCKLLATRQVHLHGHSNAAFCREVSEHVRKLIIDSERQS